MRYLRPVYQASGQQQALALPQAATASPSVTADAGPQSWPTELAQQMQAVRVVVQQATQPLSSAQVAACLQGVTAKKVRC